MPCCHLLGKVDFLALSFVTSNCEVVTFPIGVLGQVWCLIVSIPDNCPCSYFAKNKGANHDLINYMKKYNIIFFFKFKKPIGECRRLIPFIEISKIFLHPLHL